MADIEISDDEVLERKPKRSTKKVKEVKEIISEPEPVKKGRGRPKTIIHEPEPEIESEPEVVEVVKKSRGRPKKTVVEPESEPEEEIVEPVKKSRQPKPEAAAPVVSTDMMDMFSRLLKESEERMAKMHEKPKKVKGDKQIPLEVGSKVIKKTEKKVAPPPPPLVAPKPQRRGLIVV